MPSSINVQQQQYIANQRYSDCDKLQQQQQQGSYQTYNTSHPAKSSSNYYISQHSTQQQQPSSSHQSHSHSNQSCTCADCRVYSYETASTYDNQSTYSYDTKYFNNKYDDKYDDYSYDEYEQYDESQQYEEKFDSEIIDYNTIQQHLQKMDLNAHHSFEQQHSIHPSQSKTKVDTQFDYSYEQKLDLPFSLAIDIESQTVAAPTKKQKVAREPTKFKWSKRHILRSMSTDNTNHNIRHWSTFPLPSTRIYSPTEMSTCLKRKRASSAPTTPLMTSTSISSPPREEKRATNKLHGRSVSVQQLSSAIVKPHARRSASSTSLSVSSTSSPTSSVLRVNPSSYYYSSSSQKTSLAQNIRAVKYFNGSSQLPKL